jgi:hypothetical protein
MRNAMTVLGLLTGLALPGSALAQDKATYESLLDQTRASGCAPREFSDLLLMTCTHDKSLWYFTKPSHAAHPGVIRRGVEQEGDEIFIRTRGWSFASAESQAPFQQWLAQMKALDEEVRQHLRKKK